MLCTKIKHMTLKHMHIINVTVHGKGSFVRKLFYCMSLLNPYHPLHLCISPHILTVSTDDPLPLHHMPYSGGCHEYHGPMFRFLWTVEQMKPYSLKDLGPEQVVG